MPKKITPEELRSHEEVFERVKQERLKHGYRVRQVAEAAGLTEGAFFQAKYKGFSRAAMEKLGVFFGWVAPEKSAPSAPSPSLKDIPDEALKAKGITRKPVAPPAPAAVNQADQLQLATCRLSAASGAFFRARDEFFAALDEVNRLAAKL